ncbi:aminotransferase class I/II-fold pyridoxal phosphate-dependent enzyme [Cupriavidus taiwanensis]|uniref:Aminotransferase n=1 Tax=Cupriavidus taiwanensis TaxID=164546 RepID=A0A7Z7JIN9_9BURK|nr:aminotransferase class I/II-fold pyridoxal phosphate-dependent enzyme [Cupriavidus taiwanensis]SOZ19511.1 Aspartate aminotransferase B [Cupriavidus taiwanensis]SOZ97302.1 Aspartate aminotransferase B [Cupriavidus taiwanensis]SPC26190.1 Aspartate aminotransferase B [Cupriavidus taiwanensis]SPD37675.1 Aspartate aminotransferase B [Cupriavidus taiwanensis]
MNETEIVAIRLGVAKPSASIAAKARADAMRAAGRQIIDFTVGEPDFPTPKHIIDAGVAALESGHTRYTASAGTAQLRAAIASKLQRENQLGYDQNEIVVGCGAKHIIFNAFMASLNPGDEVVIPAPYWVSYPDMVLLNGGVPKIVDCPGEAGFKLSAEALERAITDKTRWVVLNSPNNPTGAVYSDSELRALGDVLLKHPNVHILTDEIYEHFVYGAARHVCLLNTTPELRSRTLLVNGLSKSHAMTGWRIGYGAGPAKLIKAITLLITQSTTCAAAATQGAAAAALEGPQQCVKDAAEMFEARRNRMVERLNAIDGIHCDLPDGAFYVFASVAGLLGRVTREGRKLEADVDVADFLREEGGVVTIDGSSYGLSPYIRFSFATSMTEIDRGCDAIAAAVSQLAKQ